MCQAAKDGPNFFYEKKVSKMLKGEVCAAIIGSLVGFIVAQILFHSVAEPYLSTNAMKKFKEYDTLTVSPSGELILQSNKKFNDAIAKRIKEAETKATVEADTAQRSSRKDDHDLRVGNVWFNGTNSAGNKDDFVRLSKKEGKHTTTNAGLAASKLKAVKELEIPSGGHLKIDDKTYSADKLKPSWKRLRSPFKRERVTR